MERQKALELAVDALEKEWRYILYASNSDISDKRLIEIAEAIKVISSMTVEEKQYEYPLSA